MSPLDCQVHLLALGDHPWGVIKARCGHLLPPGVHQQKRSPQGAHRTCPTCAAIATKPATVPGERWVSPHATAGPRLKVVEVLWGCCPADGLLHSLTPRAVCQLRSQGSATAYCGTLLAPGDLVLCGRGTPCLTCLAGSAS